MAGIYIHIPFCRRLCYYCDFYHVISHNDNSEYINALKKETEIREEYLSANTISTIYFGGGTPSVFSAKELGSVLDHLRKHYVTESLSEITVELNPDDLTQDYLNDLRKIGINRISLGVQSWRDEDLRMMNRRHTAEQACYAVEKSIKAGFENISVDLIYGIPGMGPDGWASNLDKTLSFDIRHLSAYHLTIEPDTIFGKMKKKGLLEEIDEDESTAEFHMLIEKTESAGLIHYEISNFGKLGYFSIHNTNYWKQVPYMGLGPSAHSFNGYSRQWNLSDVKKYIKSLKSGKLLFEKEELDIKTKFNEYVMTSLRTMWGIDLDYVEEIFEKEGYDYIINLSGKFINYGLMKQENKNLVLTNQGKMISDNIISEFMMPAEK